MIKAIVAMDGNGLIGNGNKLPWRVPEDLAWFKEKTINQICVMGRKTFESLPSILKNREIYILTTNKDYKAEGAQVIHSVEDVLNIKTDRDIWICGGSEIYSLLLPYCRELYVTLILGNYSGDTYFDKKQFEEFFGDGILVKSIKNKCFMIKYLRNN